MQVTHNIADTVAYLAEVGRKADARVDDAVDDLATELVDAAESVTPVGETGKLRTAWTYQRGSLLNPTRYAGYQPGLLDAAEQAALHTIDAHKGEIANEVTRG